jgi:polysaccharide export outer membrane protein
MKTILFTLALIVSIATSLVADVPLRSGDTLEIRLSGVDSQYVMEFSGVYTIDEQGNVNLPFLGTSHAAGMPANQLQAWIETKLKEGKIYTRPTITINLPQGNRFVNMSGAVRAPGRLPYQNDFTILTAIGAAGGPNDYAGDAIFLTREGKKTKYSRKALSKDPEKDIKVQPGDLIELKQSIF